MGICRRERRRETPDWTTVQAYLPTIVGLDQPNRTKRIKDMALCFRLPRECAHRDDEMTAGRTFSSSANSFCPTQDESVSDNDKWKAQRWWGNNLSQ
jgi:hypothetical protein